MKGLVFTTETRGKAVEKKAWPMATTAAAAVFFISCTTMAEPVKKDTTPKPAQNISAQVTWAEDAPAASAQKEGAGQTKKQGYDVSTDPFSLKGSDIIQRLELSGDGMTKLATMFSRLRRGGDMGVKVMDMTGKAPRTAAGVLESGGDCTDLTNLAIAIMKNQGIPGGAVIVHFRGDPAGLEHMVPYAKLDGEKVIVDLQTAELGDTQKGNYDIVLVLDFAQAASMYHREYGDYLRDQGKGVEAITAYKRAVEIFDGDAYVHQNLGVLYEKNGDMESAARHLKRAAELDPRYSTDSKRGSYNEELQAGEEAYKNKDWKGCVEHFKNALNSGEKLSKDEKKAIQSYVDVCDKNAAGN